MAEQGAHQSGKFSPEKGGYKTELEQVYTVD